MKASNPKSQTMTQIPNLYHPAQTAIEPVLVIEPQSERIPRLLRG
jgi:hypothetical protein